MPWLTAKQPVLLQSEANIMNAKQQKLVNHRRFNWVSVEKTLAVSPLALPSCKTPPIRRSWLRAKLKTVNYRSYNLASVEKTLGCVAYLLCLKYLHIIYFQV